MDVQLFILTASGQCIQVFEHKNFEGKKLDVCINSDSKCYKLNDEWNKKISSINTHDRCVVLHENNNCSGRHIRLFPNDGANHRLEISRFDNITSSISLCRDSDSVDWYSIDGIDFDGLDSFYENSNEKECKEHCINDHKCEFIVVSSDGRECWSKYYGEYEVRKNKKRRVMSYKEREFIRERGESYRGNDIDTINNINKNQCEDICRIHPKCTAANFLPSKRKCFIKNMNSIEISYDPNMIGIREDLNCIPFDSSSISSNSTFDRRCFILDCNQNGLWIGDQNKCRNKGNHFNFSVSIFKFFSLNFRTNK